MDFENIIIGTSSYDKAKSGNLVSITGDGGAAWNYFGSYYKRLAPRLVTYERYVEGLKNLGNIKDKDEYQAYRNYIEYEYIKSYYETRLLNMNVYELLETLYKKFGKDIILLCHESINEFCHRRVLADYIELETEIYIPEVSVDDSKNLTKVNPIRYKKVLNKVIGER